MPYIELDSRPYLDQFVKAPELSLTTPGDLNYAITQLCLNYGLFSTPNYAQFNEIIGVLECVKQEFYRRAVAPYEDRKIQENGDVYP